MGLPVPQELQAILSETRELQNAYLVGGCVRDALLNLSVKDFDIEVFGVDYDRLAQVLSAWGRTDLVGRSFGVVKLTTRRGCTYDFTIPRVDSKVAAGHKGFEVDFDPTIQPRKAASRRDFTINALMYDPREDRILDFFQGQADLENRVLRHTSEAFPEDPLRVLRGMQFAARFALTPAPETLALCRTIRSSHRELAVERVREEWVKWATRSQKPSLGLQFLADTGWLENYPELQVLGQTPQDPAWHPEGDVFVHTCHCCDALVTLPEWTEADDTSRLVYMLATLTHDLGKPATTEEVERDGRKRIISPAHDEKGEAIAEEFLRRIDMPIAIRKRVLPLVRNHMAHVHGTFTDRAVRRLARRLEPENIHGLTVVMAADHAGRPPLSPDLPDSIRDLKAQAEALHVRDSAPDPFLMGRHLVDLGLKPGPTFTVLLEGAYEAQLEGEIQSLDDAYAWLRTQSLHPLDPAILAKLDT